MKKLLLFLGIITLGFTLVACEGGEVEVTAPSLVSMLINDEEPIQNGDFKLFLQAKSETVRVQVNFNNPDNLPITSVVINGNNYRSHNFLEGSSNTTVYFELNTGSQLGEKTYTINEIVYKVGENSLSVRDFTVNNQFVAKVYKEDPVVSRENYQLFRDVISVDFKIDDPDNVISVGTLKAQLFAGETLVTEKALEAGFVNVMFDELLANKQYEVKVKASYDTDDGNGLLNNVILYSGSFTTLSNGIPSAVITNIDIDSNKVGFDVEFSDEDDVVVPGGLSVGIFRDNVLVEEINISGSVSGLSFDDLFNDNEYQIKVLGDYDLDDGLGVQENSVLTIHTFSTLPKAVPVPEIRGLIIQENQIDFDIFIEANDIIIEDTIIAKVYVDDEEIKTAEVINNHVDFQINNVFANSDFTIVLFADYDLNDDNGIQEGMEIFRDTYSTQLNQNPEVYVGEVVVEQGYVTVDLEVSDPNETLTGALQMVLYENDQAVDTILFDVDESQVVFKYPVKSEFIYYVEVLADYDLRDGYPVKIDDLLYRSILISHERKAPTTEFSNVVITTSTIDLNIELLDADQTIQANTSFAYLLLNDVVVDQVALVAGTNVISFDTLLSNNNYSIEVRTDYEYDLKEGSQILTNKLLGENEVLTEANELPTADVTNINSNPASFEFDVDILDPSGVIVPGSVRADLYFEDVLIDTIALTEGGNFDILFDTLYSNNSYDVLFIADYNLNDGQGNITDYVIGTSLFNTTINRLPNAAILDQVITEDSIVLDINVIDLDNVIIGNTKAVLYEGETNTGVEVPLSPGINAGVTFDNVYSDTRYYIHIVTDYNLNDNKADVLAYEMEFVGYTTTSFFMITAEFGAVTATKDTITFDVTVEDVSSISTGNLQAVLYKDDVATGDTVALVNGENNGKVFTGLESESTYKIKIETDYDLNLPSGEVLGFVLAEELASTAKLVPPTAITTNLVRDYDSFKMDIILDNPDGTISGVRNAVLYKDDAPAGQVVALNDGVNLEVEFTGLLANNTYEVRVVVDYDLNDVAGEQVGAEILSEFVTTREKFIPVVVITDLEITRDYVTFDFDYTDEDNVLDPGTLIATLYIGGVPGPSITLLTDSVSFDISGLIADFDFDVVITGDYNLDDGTGDINDGELHTESLSTIANLVPVAEIGKVYIKQESVDVTVVVLDADSIINGLVEAVLYDKDGIEQGRETIAVGSNDVSFDYTVNHAEMYSIVIEADYNLLDGTGNKTDQRLAETEAIIYNKLVPEAVVSNIVVNQDSITFDVAVYDNDAVINGTLEAVLYKDGVPTGATLSLNVGPNNGKSFGTLLSDNDYEIRIITSYDNGNGNGTYANVVLDDTEQTTLAKALPVITVALDDVLSTEIIYDIHVADTDTTGSTYTAILYDGAVQVDSEVLSLGDNFNVTFDGLLGNKTYTLEVEVNYNLDDGNGAQTAALATDNQLTTTSIAPTAALSGNSSTQKAITIDVTYTDEDSLATSKFVRIYYLGALVQEVALSEGFNDDVLFNGLAPNKEYVIKVEATYNLNDGDGVQTDVVLVENTYSTASLIAITSDDTVTIAKRRNEVEVVINDPDGIITSTWITATLKENGSTIDTYLFSNPTTIIDMINLYSGYDYELEFSLTYDVGGGDVTETVYTYSFTTLELDMLDIAIEATEDMVMSDLEVDIVIGADDDEIVTNLEVALYRNGVFVTAIALTEDFANTITFPGVDGGDGDIYTIVVRGDVDYNDGNGVHLDEHIESRTWIDAGH